jgi:hypothetical protein
MKFTQKLLCTTQKKKKKSNRNITKYFRRLNNRKSRQISPLWVYLWISCQRAHRNLNILPYTQTSRHKNIWQSGGTNPCILNLGTWWRWVVIFTFQLFYLLRRSPRYQLKKTVWAPESFWTRWWRERILPLTRHGPQSSIQQTSHYNVWAIETFPRL